MMRVMALIGLGLAMARTQPTVSKARCTSQACSHTTGGHCGVMMCGNYRGDCPVHA